MSTVGAAHNRKARWRVWAMVFSSLCMEPEAQPLKLDDFKGPVRVITWDDDLSRDCLKSKKAWLEASANDKLEVLNLGVDNDAIKAAMAGLAAFAADIFCGRGSGLGTLCRSGGWQK